MPHTWGPSSSRQWRRILLDLADVGNASQGSYLAAQIGSEIAGTGIQTVGGQEPARAAGADGGRSCPAHGETQTSQNLHSGGGGRGCWLHLPAAHLSHGVSRLGGFVGRPYVPAWLKPRARSSCPINAGIASAPVPSQEVPCSPAYFSFALLFNFCVCQSRLPTRL